MKKDNSESSYDFKGLAPFSKCSIIENNDDGVSTLTFKVSVDYPLCIVFNSRYSTMQYENHYLSLNNIKPFEFMILKNPCVEDSNLIEFLLVMRYSVGSSTELARIYSAKVPNLPEDIDNAYNIFNAVSLSIQNKIYLENIHASWEQELSGALQS